MINPPSSLLETYDYSGHGYQPLIDSGEWRVARLDGRGHAAIQLTDARGIGGAFVFDAEELQAIHTVIGDLIRSSEGPAHSPAASASVIPQSLDITTMSSACWSVSIICGCFTHILIFCQRADEPPKEDAEAHPLWPDTTPHRVTPPHRHTPV